VSEPELNPYAAPISTADGDDAEVPEVIDPNPIGTTRGRLFIPGAMLLLLSVGSSWLYLARLLREDFHFGLIVILAIQLAQLYGAINCFTLRSVRACDIGAKLSVVPAISPFILLGIPFGIWLLAELRRPTAKRAFELVSGKRRRRVVNPQSS